MLPEADIARLVVARTFLGELEECITRQHYEGYSGDESGLLGRRFQAQFTYTDQHIPIAWHYAALAAEDLVPEWFQAKLADPSNSDHNRQHLGHVGNNVIIGSTYSLRLQGFNDETLRDAAMVLMSGSFTHDHLQIDKRIKDGHDYLGGLFTAGLMRLARLKWGLPFTERQEKLAAFSVYWHSYPEKMKNGLQLPAAKNLLQTFGQSFSLDDQNSLFGWLNWELCQRQVNLADFDLRIEKSDESFAVWLAERLAAGDKRASYAPPFLAVLRTIMTGNKLFIDKDSLGKPWEYFSDNIQKDVAVTRTFFEDSRDFREVGFSAFEINWLKINKGKKLNYLFQIASALTTGNLSLVDEKFRNYITEVIYESFREKAIDGPKRGELLKILPNLLKQQDHALFNELPQNLTKTIELIILEYNNARKIFNIKGQELRSELADAGISNATFLQWLKSLISKAREKNNLNIVGRHTPVPENMPVYCVSLGVVK